MEGTDLKKARKELELVKEKYRKTDRNLKNVMELIESYKKDRQSLQTKLKQANAEMEMIEKRLAEEKLNELNDFRQQKKAEVGLAVVRKRMKQFQELSERQLTEVYQKSGIVANDNIFDTNIEQELFSKINNSKERIDKLAS